MLHVPSFFNRVLPEYAKNYCAHDGMSFRGGQGGCSGNAHAAGTRSKTDGAETRMEQLQNARNIRKKNSILIFRVPQPKLFSIGRVIAAPPHFQIAPPT
jgi:hypothetical protein